MRRVALVTGAGAGIGAAIARHVVSKDVAVAVHFNSSEAAAKRTVMALRKKNSDCSMVQADLRDAEQTRKMVELVEERYGRIDVLVNNVGNFVYKALATTTDEEWGDVIETNLSATFRMCSAVLPIMRKQKYGRIVNMGQVDAERMAVREMTTPYAIAKTGVLMLTKQLAADNAKYGIRVNAVSPGIVETAKVKLKMPSGSFIAIDSVAQAVAYMASDDSSQVSGANLEVADGFTFG